MADSSAKGLKVALTSNPIFGSDFYGSTPAEVLALQPVWNLALQGGFAAYQPEWQNIATEAPVDESNRLILIAADRPQLIREWVGDRVENAIVVRSIDITPLPYESTLAIDKYQFQDTGRVGHYYNGVFANWGMQMKAFPDALLGTAFGLVTVTVGYDGAPFVSNSHPVNPEDPTTATWTNILINTPLTTENLAVAVATFKNVPGRDGLPWSNRKAGIKLVVPTSTEFAARQAVQSTMIGRSVAAGAGGVGGAATEENVFLSMAVDDVVVLQTISDQTSWFLTDNHTASYGPFVLGMREPFYITPKISPTDDNVFFERKLVYGIEGRLCISVTLMQNILGCYSGSGPA